MMRLRVREDAHERYRGAAGATVRYTELSPDRFKDFWR
jgi:hypothetical protein